MPKNTDISSILIIGAGPIVIGQACEFDYSGTQACKALREEGYRVILVNSNPATIMTDPDMANATYIEPITPEFVEKIIARERPDALLPTMGGQTALNCAKALAESGILEKYNVKLIGASLEAINKAEDRRLFADAMSRIGLECPKQGVAHSLEQAELLLQELGLPAIIRPSFTMGGTGGGIAYTHAEFVQIVKAGLEASPVNEVLIDESVLGWKEYEMEVVRDRADNCIIVCSIENVDPMGVHTGDSITVAPALTLTDKEYQIMRDASIAVLREIGVDTGGSNVQFAVNPKDGRMVVIEMNPRVSRSSALASKATGFPIAKVAAKLAVGYTLDEIINDVTRATPASFEPSIDYVVTKIPRFAFEKFPEASRTLTTAMKSVGEAMAMGRNFKESLQKALRALENGYNGLNEIIKKVGAEQEIIARLKQPTPERLLIVADAFRHGFTVEQVHEYSYYDPWFLRQIEEIVQMEAYVKANGLPQNRHDLLYLKKQGFSDARLAILTNSSEKEVRALRENLNIRPVYKRIDTCAAEFEALTPYMYSTYEGDSVRLGECESEPSEREKIIILGGGPNRIGQGIEFDYCCVHAAYALSEAGFETIMVNCNPETVSTDYDTSDRLYFEPLTAEDVINLIKKEQENGYVRGVIVQFGGQTPLKLARALESVGIPIIGTSPDAIDLAEDRERFQKLLYNLELKQPQNNICNSEEEVLEQAEEMGYPVVVRPSYVLGGRAMQIIYDSETLKIYLQEVLREFSDNPILIDTFLKDAIEIDVDALCDGQNVYIAGIMEHIEEAGIHSGDSACSLPTHTLGDEMVEELTKQTIMLAKALRVVGLINIQFAIKDGEIFVIEVNPRASRTVPFVAKAIGKPVAKFAARLMAGEKLQDLGLSLHAKYAADMLKHVAVKEVVLPFKRFAGVDIILGPEMKSTGEVMGIADNFEAAFAKAYLATGSYFPNSGAVFVSVKDSDKKSLINICQILLKMGFTITATAGTAKYLSDHGIKAEAVNKVRQGSPHVVDYLKAGKINLVINTTEGVQSVRDSASIRQTALSHNIAYSTTMAGAKALVAAMQYALDEEELEVCSIQEYHANIAKN
jgi:carbamoyl-phosphate synthase large subunit